MTSNSIQPDRDYLCREETSGENFGGSFHINDAEMAVALASFGKPLPDLAGDAIVIRLENGRVATLHDTVLAGSTSHHSSSSKVEASLQRIIANIAVIGSRAWSRTDPIKKVYFSVTHSDDLLFHIGKFEAVANSSFDKITDNKLFEFSVLGNRISAWYSPSGNMTFNYPTKVDVRYLVEFEHARILDNYLMTVQSIVTFLSAALGCYLGPSNIQISTLSQEETEKALKANAFAENFAVQYIWPVRPPRRSLWVGNSFAHVRSDNELAAFQACLGSWIERDMEWRKAADLMMTSLSLEGEISGDRLLSACRWLEQIPGTASKAVISDTDIEKIASVAASEACRLGYDGFEARISGIIRHNLKSETNAQRIARLTSAVRERFGDSAFDQSFALHLQNAIKFRGRVAHGHFSSNDEDDYTAFVTAIYAVEALAYLLSIKDLPMTAAGAQRAIGRPIVSNYRRSN